MPADAEADTDKDKDTASDTDGVIADERAHLARSREFLHLMRENVLELAKNPMAGDRVSLEYLKADLYRRAEALKDLPDAPLFFGRLDYSELASKDADFAGSDFHIGRRHVHDPEGTPVVLDWRAPVSRPFYRASQPEPMGLTLRRRFGFAGGALTAYEDERFSGHGEATDAPDRSEKSALESPSNLLISEIERPRSGPMRDIVATIQPEQDDIVRGGRRHDRVRAGRAGHREDRRRPAPGRLPAVRAQGAGDQARRDRRGTEPGLPLLHQERAARARRARRHPDHGDRPGRDDPHPRRRQRRGGRPSRATRGWPTLLRGVLWASIRPPAQALVLSRGTRRLRVPAHEIEALADELRDRGVRYGTGRELLAHRIAHVILLQLEAAGRDLRRPHPRLRPALRAGPQVRGPGLAEGGPEAAGLRPPFRSKSAHLERPRAALSRRAGPHRLAEGPARPRLGPLDPRRPGADRRGGRSHRAHAVASPTWWWTRPRTCRRWRCGRSGGAARPGRRPCSATSRRAPPRGRRPPGPSCCGTWASRTRRCASSTSGYRVPRQILDYASRLLPSIAPGLGPAGSLRADPDALAVVGVGRGRARRRVAAGCAAALERARLGRRDLRGRPGGGGRGGAAGRRARLRRARRARPESSDNPRYPNCGRRPAGDRAGHAGQGTRVRPRGAGRAWPDRDRRGLWPAAALRGAHPGGFPAHGISRRAPAGRASVTYH